MTIGVTDRTTDDALLANESTWSGRIYSDGWVELWTEGQWVTSREKAEPFPF